MKKNLHYLFIIIPVILLLAGMIFISTQKHIYKNAPDCIGNTAGNLNNKGLFCESDGRVYFSNAYDHGMLYSMNPDETDFKKITNVAVSSINADKKRVYYSQTDSGSGSGLGYIRNSVGFYSCSKKGGNSICYTKDPTAIVALSGNYLYFQHHHDNSTTTDKISIQKDEIQTIVNDMITPASVVSKEGGNVIYYNGMTDDHYLYELNTLTDASTLVWEHQLYNPVYQDGYIYFMDLETNYELHSYNLATGEEKTLTTDRLDYFNVYDSIIYYQKSSTTEPALKRIYIDGTGEEIVKEGVFESVNITSQYAYFHGFKKPVPVYHQSTFGAVNPTEFKVDIKD